MIPWVKGDMTRKMNSMMECNMQIQCLLIKMPNETTLNVQDTASDKRNLEKRWKLNATGKTACMDHEHANYKCKKALSPGRLNSQTQNLKHLNLGTKQPRP